MLNTRKKYNINLEQKVDIVFAYLFDNDKAEEEEFFWNRLNSAEIKELNETKKEDYEDFSKLKKMVYEEN